MYERLTLTPRNMSPLMAYWLLPDPALGSGYLSGSLFQILIRLWLIQPIWIRLSFVCSTLPLKLNLRSDCGVSVCQTLQLASFGVFLPCLISLSRLVLLPTTRLVLCTSTFSVSLSAQEAHLSSFFAVALALLNPLVPLCRCQLLLPSHPVAL